ncbi:prolyl oligopeptidase family serine peptidase [Pseudomonas aeruginosa]|nr:prolyl oligopeptidase family serine peptidase [Pseudomonas aeruginosa]EKV0748155.1 S9 family peptidase [Pseudomonas aeruginosa]MCL8037161.1 prolyl oligopeptidase family serine peptidase [Pseudomonas aeruginosa]MCL8058031.1 prolyl oligopeptidase family serine peptidase [Pseudomonas aeruginosa]MCM1997386.1 prolyl oligopeptidase family serine peptidase [Pseudomonas aeruginosa]MCM2002353.1 prolyl oligopeptidase family serine peptidase [Pseudomonas aeruginosa]
MPDPALSTGYGRGFIQRGWGAWGDAPYQDLLAISDAAQARDDIDGQRSAAMGGSFGGYMANWIAGHTDRFRAIVSHASLWTLSQFGPTTDAYHYWRQEIGAQMLQHHSPHRFVRDIRTPMLIIHGDKDYPVPIGEALSLWAQLAEQFADEQGRMPHKFLYYPGENHWILARRTPRSGTRRCSPSSPNTSMAKPGNAPRRWDEAAAGTAGKRPAVDPLRRARRRSRAVRRRAGDPRRAARLGIVAAVGTGRAVCAGGYAEIRQKLGHSFCNLLYLKD